MYHICSETSTLPYIHVPGSQRHVTFVDRHDRSDNKDCCACVCVCVCVCVWGCCGCVCVCGSVCVNGGVRVSHMIIGRTERCKCDWTVGGQSNRRTKKIVWWWASVLGLHSRQYYGYWRDRKHVMENWIIHKECVWRASLGDLDVEG